MERALARQSRQGVRPARVRRPSERPVRLMIVDDSLIVRTVLTRLAQASDDLEVVAVAGDVKRALEALATTYVDVILLDLEMPGTGGLEALPQIIAAARGARILVVSALTVDGADQTLKAMALGAADTLAKPTSGGFDDGYREVLLARIRALGAGAQGMAKPADVRTRPTTRRRAKAAEIIAIGASTGGIHALSQLFAGLPKRLDVPILVTQHLPSSFMEVFARQLRMASGYETLVAQEDMLLEPNVILLAPGDAHMTVVRRAGRFRIRLDRTPQTSGCTPSVDPMFASLATAVGGHALGVVLSGMGRDGVEGAARLVAAGGTVLAQDEASCAVWGMPRAIAEAGLAAAILPPGEIACRIAANISQETRR